MGHKGYYGQYSGNAKWSRNHADTKVTKENYKASERDDAAHIDYLKRDVDYDNKHGHSDENMTADEKHISKLAGDMKYDKKHHGSPTKHVNKHMDKDHPHNKRKDHDDTIHSHKGKPGKTQSKAVAKMLSPVKQTTGVVEKFKKDTDKVISKASKIKAGEIHSGWNPDKPPIEIYREPKITNKKPKSKEPGTCLPGAFTNCWGK